MSRERELGWGWDRCVEEDRKVREGRAPLLCHHLAAVRLWRLKLPGPQFPHLHSPLVPGRLPAAGAGDSPINQTGRQEPRGEGSSRAGDSRRPHKTGDRRLPSHSGVGNPHTPTRTHAHPGESRRTHNQAWKTATARVKSPCLHRRPKMQSFSAKEERVYPRTK